MSWQVKKLGEVCTIVSGGTPKTGVDSFWGGEIAWITPKDMGSNGDFYVSKTSRTITSEGLEKSSAKLILENSVILSTRAPIGHLAINLVAMATNQGCRGIIPGPTVITKFLFYYLYSKVKELDALGSGTTFKELSKKNLESFYTPVPLIEEQKRIVAILDSAFEQIDQAKAIAQQNLQNAREIFDSALSRVSLPKRSWVSARLQDITLKIGSGATPRGGQSSYKTEGVSLVRSMNVHDRSFEPNKLAFIDDEQAAKLSNVIVEKDDVLLNITGASVARSCLMSSAYLPARVNQHVSIIRPFSTIIRPKLLNFFLTSKAYKDSLLKIGGSGATREAITKKQIQDFVIYFPKSTDEQDTLIKQVEEIENLSQNLESIYQQKIAALDELKQSLLQQAFSGKLTANHSGAPV
jgi:type I restriction enzyme S subunit